MRRLVAALACRVQGTRLYGKPVQNLMGSTRILDQILDTIARLPEIQATVLGIAEGEGNQVFEGIARERGIPFVWGSHVDVLQRLIDCGEATGATDIFRVTTECPFMYFEAVSDAWQRHLAHDNDVTVVDALPIGALFEIYKLDALRVSHERGDEKDRSELCSRYIRLHRDAFRVEVLFPEAACQRPDLRLTVDYPEDLVLCRRVYEALADKAPLIPMRDIVAYLDAHPDVARIVAPYATARRIWPDP